MPESAPDRERLLDGRPLREAGRFLCLHRCFTAIPSLLHGKSPMTGGGR